MRRAVDRLGARARRRPERLPEGPGHRVAVLVDPGGGPVRRGMGDPGVGTAGTAGLRGIVKDRLEGPVRGRNRPRQRFGEGQKKGPGRGHRDTRQPVGGVRVRRDKPHGLGRGSCTDHAVGVVLGTARTGHRDRIAPARDAGDLDTVLDVKTLRQRLHKARHSGHPDKIALRILLGTRRPQRSRQLGITRGDGGCAVIDPEIRAAPRGQPPAKPARFVEDRDLVARLNKHPRRRDPRQSRANDRDLLRHLRPLCPGPAR